jgi:hypothetical protein
MTVPCAVIGEDGTRCQSAAVTSFRSLAVCLEHAAPLADREQEGREEKARKRKARKQKTPWPRCQEPRKDGSTCASVVASRDARFCPYHLRQHELGLAEFGDAIEIDEDEDEAA